MMTIVKSSSNYQILESGSAITFNHDSDMRFEINMSNDFSFILVLTFSNNGDKDRNLIKDVKDNTITLHCINFDQGLGAGIKSPIELATFNNKKVYFVFWISPLGSEGLKLISYTFFSEN